MQKTIKSMIYTFGGLFNNKYTRIIYILPFRLGGFVFGWRFGCCRCRCCSFVGILLGAQKYTHSTHRCTYIYTVPLRVSVRIINYGFCALIYFVLFRLVSRACAFSVLCYADPILLRVVNFVDKQNDWRKNNNNNKSIQFYLLYTFICRLFGVFVPTNFQLYRIVLFFCSFRRNNNFSIF